ncbi:DUF397 domain-containing protein [Streptomyces sp. AK08-02]|uniref:DUF397 domain-containing protein n=1 Tax=Streptomyces sp. AK08-02 TaxID=3028654 RepID=UPI0029A5CA17|nr:DUF397 domain-containing protein [Streptomyces sp. AK08-02]MDX3747556.1 DUF397 domain-containing protein [Streptomyces sp. AK08-02]
MSNAGPNSHASLTWFTSSYSNGAGGECVECALTGDSALVRDSKCAGRAVIVVRGQGWRAFVGGLGEGKLKG